MATFSFDRETLELTLNWFCKPVEERSSCLFRINESLVDRSTFVPRENFLCKIQ